MPARHTFGPRLPFRCACGERAPHRFDGRYKSICRACRSKREAARLRAKSLQEVRA